MILYSNMAKSTKSRFTSDEVVRFFTGDLEFPTDISSSDDEYETLMI